jgi:hypothetical protein
MVNITALPPPFYSESLSPSCLPEGEQRRGRARGSEGGRYHLQQHGALQDNPGSGS